MYVRDPELKRYCSNIPENQKTQLNTILLQILLLKIKIRKKFFLKYTKST